MAVQSGNERRTVPANIIAEEPQKKFTIDINYSSLILEIVAYVGGSALIYWMANELYNYIVN